MSIYAVIIPYVVLSALIFGAVLLKRPKYFYLFLVLSILVPSLLPALAMFVGENRNDPNAPWGIFVAAYALFMSIILNGLMLIVRSIVLRVSEN